MQAMKSKIVTFYSYKGGVGRTMALANVAWLLAEKYRKKVLVVDWDLEAPGLHRFFNIREEEIAKGLIDLFYDYKDLLRKELSSLDEEFINIDKYITRLSDYSTGGSISILPAGRYDGKYASRVNDFNWDLFYKNWYGFGFIEYLKKQLRKRADIILVDSRTGVTDIGGICTLQMPDIEVLLFSLNEQNISGTEMIIKCILEKSTEVTEQKTPPKLILVPSRVERYLEKEIKNKWEEIAAKRLSAYLPVGEDTLYYIKKKSIPYVGYFSFGEMLAVKEDPYGELAESLDNLAIMVLKASGMVEYNPFSNRAMIKSPDEFFGRKTELTAILSRLSNLQSCDVSGERKIGKSSLLYYIFMKLRDGDEYRIAYIDMQDAKYHTVKGFLKYSLDNLGSGPGVISSNSHNENLIAFSDSITDLRKKIKPVLLIDEIENLTVRPKEFNNDFFDAMRSLGSHGNIAYVTASLHPLKRLCEIGKFTSPFYNIFSQVPVGQFSPEETTEFLSARREGFEFNKREIEFIKRIANNHPLYLQIACYHVFENRGKKWDEKKLRKEIEKEIKNFDDKWARKKRGFLELVKALFYYFNEFVSVTKRI